MEDLSDKAQGSNSLPVRDLVIWNKQEYEDTTISRVFFRDHYIGCSIEGPNAEKEEIIFPKKPLRNNLYFLAQEIVKNYGPETKKESMFNLYALDKGFSQKYYSDDPFSVIKDLRNIKGIEKPKEKLSNLAYYLYNNGIDSKINEEYIVNQLPSTEENHYQEKIKT